MALTNTVLYTAGVPPSGSSDGVAVQVGTKEGNRGIVRWVVNTTGTTGAPAVRLWLYVNGAWYSYRDTSGVNTIPTAAGRSTGMFEIGPALASEVSRAAIAAEPGSTITLSGTPQMEFFNLIP